MVGAAAAVGVLRVRVRVRQWRQWRQWVRYCCRECSATHWMRGTSAQGGVGGGGGCCRRRGRPGAYSAWAISNGQPPRYMASTVLCPAFYWY